MKQWKKNRNSPLKSKMENSLGHLHRQPYFLFVELGGLAFKTERFRLRKHISTESERRSIKSHRNGSLILHRPLSRV